MSSDASSLASEPTASSPRQGLAHRLVDRLLPAPTIGRLRLVLPNGGVITRHGAHPGPDAEMSMRRWRGFARMLVGGEHGFADGYLDGDWSTPDLSALLELFMHNEAAFARPARPSPLTHARNRLFHHRRANTRHGSRRNIAAHYDLGNAFYASWLDRGMNYSSALYSGDETLEAAQEAKLDRVAELLDLGAGEHVLEIGCGWGALAERLVRRHGCSVVGVTLSTEQLAYAKARLADTFEAGRAELLLRDYRDVRGAYDRIVSIEMLEAVGERYWPVYFDKLRASLSPGGIAVLQVITMDESRYAAYRSHPDFIQRHIFPGGMLPTVARVEAEAARAGLTLAHRQPFGDSYARTLQAWRSRFTRAWATIEPLGFDQRFRRMWEYYLTYCEVGFRFAAVDVSLFKFQG